MIKTRKPTQVVRRRALVKIIPFLFLTTVLPVIKAGELIDHDHPTIVATAATICRGLDRPRTRAVAIHDFVRDEIAFGWTGRFYDMKASEVLRAKIGYCNTKSTLFVALLRAAGIPARIRYVGLNAEILHGLVDAGRPYVDHSYVEVELDGRWVRTDSYIVDERLFWAARSRLQKEKRKLGYGIHLNGRIDWDGGSDCFAQFVDDGAVTNLSDQDYGIHEDIGRFYATGQGRDQLMGVVKWLFPTLIKSATQRAEVLRSESQTE